MKLTKKQIEFYRNSKIELWLPVPNYKGAYEVSTFGKVKSLKRKAGKGRFIKERILASHIRGSGYLSIGLFKNNKRLSRNIHLIVAEAFLNHNSNKSQKLIVNHINHNKKDNRLINLNIISHRENCNLKHLPSSSKYVGVSWYKRDKKWKAQIQINRVQKNLGSFDSEDKAAEAYQKALMELLIS